MILDTEIQCINVNFPMILPREVHSINVKVRSHASPKLEKYTVSTEN